MRDRRVVLLLSLAAFGAACGGQDQTAVDPLGRDIVLANQVQSDAVEREISAVGGTGTCRAEPSPVQPTGTQLARASQLMRQAQELELMGDMSRAHQLLVQAAQNDGTNPTLAYHLARSSDALQQKSTAVDAYCRFLTLSPGTAQAAEVRTRLAMLLETEVPSIDAQATQATQAKARRASAAKATGRVSRSANGTVSRQMRGSQPRNTRIASRTPSRVPAASIGGGAVTGSSNGAVDASVNVNDGERVTPARESAQQTAATAPAPSTPARKTTSTASNTTRGAIIGAAAGAVVGAVVGRDVKSGMIGAATGGLLGAAVGRGTMRGQALRGRYATPTWSPR